MLGVGGDGRCAAGGVSGVNRLREEDRIYGMMVVVLGCDTWKSRTQGRKSRMWDRDHRHSFGFEQFPCLLPCFLLSHQTAISPHLRVLWRQLSSTSL